jgi:hypothetical protein
MLRGLSISSYTVRITLVGPLHHMNIHAKILFVKQSLTKLKALDKTYSVFGSERHKYLLNNALEESEVSALENKHNIRLPEDYRRFITEIGNGGAGPYYGLETIEDSLFIDLDYKRENEYLNPAEPFLLTQKWNMEFTGDSSNEQEYQVFEKEYFKDSWVNGLLRICNFGCGVSLNLVVNGAEYGTIWVDDRGSEGGIFPDPYFGQSERTQFLDWYILWLNKSLEAVSQRA